MSSLRGNPPGAISQASKIGSGPAPGGEIESSRLYQNGLMTPLLMVAASGLALGAGTAIYPWFALAPLVAGLIAIIFHRPVEAAIILLVAAPILLNTIKLGVLNLDNYVTLLGMTTVVLAGLSSGRLPFSGLSALPMAVGIAIALSGDANGLSWIEPTARFLGLAMIPWAVGYSARNPEFAIGAVKWSVAIGALSVIVQPLTGYPKLAVLNEEEAGTRYGGLIGHPNFAAYTLAITALLLLSRPTLRRLDPLLLSVLTVALVMTGSMTAIGFFCLAALAILVRRPRRLLFLGGLVAAVAAIAGATLLARIGSLGESGLRGDNSGTWRETQWSQALALVDGREVIGIGWQQTSKQLANGLEAHSAYVQAIVELGLVGSFLVLAAVAYLVARVHRHLVSVVLLAYVLATSITDPVLFYPSSLVVLLVAVAAVESGWPDQTDRPIASSRGAIAGCDSSPTSERASETH